MARVLTADCETRQDTRHPAEGLTLRALIAESDAAAAAVLLDVVAKMGGSATVRWDAEGAWQALRSEPFDILLVGVGHSMVEIANLLRKLRCDDREDAHPDPKIPVLLLGIQAAVRTRVTLLNAGADQYIPKPVNASLAAATIRSLIRRRITMNTPQPTYGGLRLDPDRRLVLCGKTQVQLTSTQMEILLLLARERPAAVTRQRLMAACTAHALSSSSLDFHIHHLRKHLGHHTIQTVHGSGYQLLWPSSRSPA